MNERITKIVIDTLGKEGVIASRALGYWALSDEELEKFAELVARECIKQVDEAIPESDCSASYAYRTARIAAISRIKEHFGVEDA
jgi:hypothetical protein